MNKIEISSEGSEDLSLNEFSIEPKEQKAVNFLAAPRLVDSGLSSKEWQTVRKGLSKLQEQPDYPIQNEELLKEIIDEQEQLAKLRETQNLLKEVKEKAAKKDFFKGALRVVPIAAFLGLGIISANLVNDYYTPAAVAQRAADNARNQATQKAAAAERSAAAAELKKQQDEKARQDKIAFEASHILGLEPTAFSAASSYYEWRVHYNQLNPNVGYIESGESKNYMTIDPKGEISFVGNNDLYHTYTYLDTYTRLDGKTVPMISLALDAGRGISLQSWLLRNTSDGNIDNSVVIFEDIIHHKEFPIRINMVQSDKNYKFQLAVMKKVPV